MASRPAKKAGEPAAQPKIVGARRPDETGMLPLVSLADKLEENAEMDSSATAFFAIPAPKSDGRARPSGPPTPNLAGGPVAGPPPMMGSPTNPMVSGPVAGGPMVAGPIAGGPVVTGPIAGPIAQGPVAAYNAGAAQTPFGVTGVSPPPADADQRTHSNRVYAIVLAMFFLVGVAIFAALYLAPKDKDGVTDGDETPTPTTTTTPEVKPEPKPKPRDTAVPPPEEAPTPKPKPRSPGGGGGGGSPNPNPNPTPRSSGPAALNINLTGDLAGTTMVEVNCPSGFRERGRINGTTASVPNVPQESCTLFFKGGPPARFNPVRGGQSLSCSIQGTTGVCK